MSSFLISIPAFIGTDEWSLEILQNRKITDLAFSFENI